MEADPAAAGTSSTPPSPPRQPQGEGERGAVESADPATPGRCAARGDPNPAPPPSPASAAPPPPQVPQGEEAAASSEGEQDNEVGAGVGEALRSFMEEFGDQGEYCLILSPQLKEIATPDRPAALRFLGEKYNSLMERYKKQSANCAEECAPRYGGLKKKYMDECAERRRLYNELIELRGNIRVFCRCRPLSADEVSRGCLSVVEIDQLQETELQFVPSEKERKAFKFDHVFGPEDDQEAVFSETVPVVRSVMDGFNVCIFAYGQTGTGKTFTMEGVPENRGVNYRALEELFRMSEERNASVEYTFSVSILEVYNEKIRDLLDESNEQSLKRLDIKQSADGTQEVPGLVEAPIYTIDGVWEKLQFGARNRSVGSTNANELSSRSHSLVRVTVRSEHLVTGQRSRSHMWLVDLAGSERVAKTGVDGDRLKESQFINKSLSALGDVISALASKNSHIPYRNSKLTHLLQSSLGGDCKTIMFVQISPSSTDSGETLCSLNFASRVRAVEHGPARKQVDPAESLKLKQMTEKLRHEEKENARLSQSLQLMQLKYASRENVFRSLNEKVRDAEQACKASQQRIRELEHELGIEKNAARDSARSSRPPLVPMRLRQPPQGRNSNYLPPSGPSRSRFSKAPTIQNKENVPVMASKAHPGADKDKAVGKARRVSLTPVIRQIPIQPKRRSSMAILPSLSEQLSVLNEKRAVSRLSHVHMPRRSVAAFGSVPGTPLALVDATPDGRGGKLRRIEFGSSSKFTSPPMLAMWKSRNNMATPQQKQKLGVASGSGNPSKLCFSIQKRVTLGSPVRSKAGVLSGAGIFNPALREKTVVGRTGNALRVLNTKRRQSGFI
ncbi:kinesin-like protein KIN-14J [Phragmites australis]|uniref:kinesin-like protein KIN-14J n=1 Tax=Phragmites australis TaxID=29695 RepID=UPI002D76AC30|nr:kinesin-like protein KIN-14J [Phragmites australis]